MNSSGTTFWGKPVAGTRHLPTLGFPGECRYVASLSAPVFWDTLAKGWYLLDKKTPKQLEMFDEAWA